MKTLYESLLDDLDDLENDLSAGIEKSIKKWIVDNYQVIPSSLKILKRPNKDGKLIVNASHAIFKSNSKSLTNGMFVWGKIKNQFYCGRSSITSLKGAPKEVGDFFSCVHCNSLTSLEGAPEKVGGTFDCAHCKNLKSLEGAPREAGETFSCAHCNSLTSLEGAPEKVGRNFNCAYCDSLKSLEGAPKEVGGVFSCTGCDSLKSLEGAPEKVGGDFMCAYCDSLKSTVLPTTKLTGKIYNENFSR